MTKYKCEFMGEGEEYIPNSEFLSIEAKSPEHAAKLFSDKIKRKEWPFIKVRYGFLSISGAVFKNEFYVKSDKVAEEKAERDRRIKIKTEEEEKEFKKETEKYSNLTKDELLIKIIKNQEENIFNQNEQTEALGKIRWAIIGLGFFIIVTTMMFKMKWGL